MRLSQMPVASLLLLAPALLAIGADDITTLCADRAAIEQVYHEHRTGTKKPFEETMPRAQIEQLVRLDLHKEAVLRKACRTEITDTMIEAEVQRIHTTTRAPEMLAEIKHALGDDPARFARSIARPIVVERELRSRFENDDRLHAEKRREAEQARAALLDGKPVEGMHDVTWQLGGEKSEVGSQKSEVSTPPPQTKGVAKSGAYSVEATAQLAQTLTPPTEERDRKFYFDDLDPELQKVLRVQLQKPGDVSAVIEMPGAFLIFIAKEKSAETLSAASLSIPKRSYEEWLSQQPEEKP